MRFQQPIEQARLIRRYKRFLADVEYQGKTLTVHCANPGSMLGVSRPGSTVFISHSDRPNRSLPWTLEAIRVGRSWVGIQPMRANRVVEEALEKGAIPSLRGYGKRRREAPWGPRGRADFLLEEGPQGRCWIEVKQATLARGRLALFPDSRTERGLRHLQELMKKAKKKERAVLLLLAARPDVDTVGPADGIDPDFGRMLRKAAKSGVEVLGYRIRVSRAGLSWLGSISVDLGPHLFSKEEWQ